MNKNQAFKLWNMFVMEKDDGFALVMFLELKEAGYFTKSTTFLYSV